jgi:signal peptidase I
MSGTNDHPNKDYRGYSNAPGWGILLTSPKEEFTVPAESYFALGDNSYSSYDSRGWGIVPRDNVTGRALFVYYPFASHFGWIW